ncbi:MULTISPECIES: porin [unclassified Undibacterium]|uniref:porin n=1 Tax=unclassified Undibacterium TaxID=2630295 RepID=UPI002AC9AE26|nr:MULTISPECIES: porin [unclassified Undibacterium]MEB0140665.1 porin [Undibacterium sp. CCC2.1]MEB0172429.1 porin [Undibacterium sp. CCC1.1]MEB0177681.1 porin [Undibacterium sp. CCC3.4]MEB0215551.1 porin [Undibacterium sp. 5I2]WPX43742.1 porin [Undibacterium sp. CCC3.4]
MKTPSTHFPLARALGTALAMSSLLATQAYAQQSNVTIYGRLVDGVMLTTNQATATPGVLGTTSSIGGNVWGTSLLGFKGEEDLGNGLKAMFLLENGFSGANGANNGGSSTIFSRRTLVGLSGAFGSLKLGRDLTLPSDQVWGLDPTGQMWSGTATLVKGRNWPTYNNGINYISPQFGGASVQVTYGLGEVAGSTSANSTGGIALNYAFNNYTVTAMYDFAKDAKGRASSLYQYSNELTLGGTAKLDDLTLYVGYQSLSAPDTVAVSQSKPDKTSQYWLGLNYRLSPALTLIGAAYHAKVNQHVGSASQIVVGANYSLSKRTLLYVALANVHNSALSNFNMDFNNPNTAAAGANPSAFFSGISHSF